MAGARRVVGAGPDEQAIGIGAGVQGAVIGVAQREGFGQGELERQVGAGEIGHGVIVLGRRPGIHAAVVPGRLRIGEGVRRAFQAHQFEIGLGVGVKRQDRCRHIGTGIGLDPDGGVLAGRRIGQRDRETVAEASDTRQRAEIVVKGSVFLGQDDDMLDIHDRAGDALGRNIERPGNGRMQGGGKRGSLEQGTTAGRGHGIPRGKWSARLSTAI